MRVVEKTTLGKEDTDDVEDKHFHLIHCFCKLTLDMVVDEHLDDDDE